MSEPTWLRVWLQGGPADDWDYFTLIEPPDRIKVIVDPFHDDRWIRVVGEWDGAITYERVPSVEQADSERIYYPVTT